MVTPELKWPTTSLTPSPTNLLATDTPCLGSATSSPCSTSIFWPRMPPAALMSSAACCTPWVNCAPNEAFAPVIGPATPIFNWAKAEPDNANPAASTTLANTYFFMPNSLQFGRPHQGRPRQNASTLPPIKASFQRRVTWQPTLRQTS